MGGKILTYEVQTFTTNALVRGRKVVGFEIKSLQSVSRSKQKKATHSHPFFAIKMAKLALKRKTQSKPD
jgi:hypothetical protein